MELKNIKRSIIIEGYKLTPKAIRNWHLVYVGTAEECDAYAEKLNNENGTDCAFVSCLGDFDIKNDGFSRRGAYQRIDALKNVYFVHY